MPAPFEQKRVAVSLIDDDESVRKAFSLLLRTHGFEVFGYASPADFLALERPPRCACFIMDMHMPGMTGLELVETLRKRGVMTPAIILTGRDDPQLRTRAQAAGIAAVLNKPVEGDAFVGAIRTALGVSG